MYRAIVGHGSWFLLLPFLAFGCLDGTKADSSGDRGDAAAKEIPPPKIAFTDPSEGAKIAAGTKKFTCSADIKLADKNQRVTSFIIGVYKKGVSNGTVLGEFVDEKDGKRQYKAELDIPKAKGPYVLRATATVVDEKESRKNFEAEIPIEVTE
jgi:hypothetical protein